MCLFFVSPLVDSRAFVVWSESCRHLNMQGFSSHDPPSGSVTYRFVRWVGANPGYHCNRAELQFHGVLLSGSTADTACVTRVQVRAHPRSASSNGCMKKDGGG